MALEQEFNFAAIVSRLRNLSDRDGEDDTVDGQADIEDILYWLTKDQFVVREANGRLARYRAGDNPLDDEIWE